MTTENYKKNEENNRNDADVAPDAGLGAGRYIEVN